jgi:hypothetical protein
MHCKSKFIAVAACFSVAATGHAQDATLQNARYCGLGVQGALPSFRRDNPTLSKFYDDPAFRARLYKILFERSKAAGWKINLFEKGDTRGAGASLGLSHVLTFENVEVEPFVDPRDGKVYNNVAYSFGVNTVLFDTADRQIKTVAPSVVTFSEVRATAPDALARQAGFNAIFQGFGQSDSAIERWAASARNLPVSYDERTFFPVLPVALSEDAKAALGKAAQNASQTPGAFVKRLTAQYEAMLATSFGKPIVPVAVNDDGSVATGNQYVANIPECLGTSSSLTLPSPSYRMRLTLDKVSNVNLRHDMPATQEGLSSAAYQTEFAYGVRYKSEILRYDDLNGDKPIDERMFRYVRALRFTGDRAVNGYSQYAKLSSNFVKDLLAAYVAQNKDWVKENVSAAADKKLGDPSKIVKDWKALFQGTMKTAPTANRGS